MMGWTLAFLLFFLLLGMAQIEAISVDAAKRGGNESREREGAREKTICNRS